MEKNPTNYYLKAQRYVDKYHRKLEAKEQDLEAKHDFLVYNQLNAVMKHDYYGIDLHLKTNAMAGGSNDE